MRRARIYLDTSVINFLFADDAPEKQEVTIEFFEHYVKIGIYEVCVSPIVLDEIKRTKDEIKRQKLIDVIDEYSIGELDLGENRLEIERMAERYIHDGIIPAAKLEDALHVAVATVFQMDILLSWNYKHLANVNKETRISDVNRREGYSKPLRLTTPLEVVFGE